MRLPHLLVLALVISFAVLSAPPAIAQAEKNATLVGRLTDPSGAAIAGAVVAAKPLDSSGRSAQAKSGPGGRFSLTLAPGPYRVRIERTYFAPLEGRFALVAGETRTWNARLNLQPLSSNVTVTAAAEPQTLQATAAPVDVITRTQIDDRQEIFLTSALAAVPGVSFSQLGPLGGVTSFFLDGGNSNYTKFLVDGVPVNEPGGAVDLSDFTLDGVDKIEVVHGASSALYGSDAMAGVVQIFTRRGETRVPLITVESDGGAFGTGHGAAGISGLAGKLDYAVSAGYFGSSGQGQDSFFRDTTLSGNFGWTFSQGNSLRLVLRNNSSDAGQPGQTLLGPPVPGQTTGLHDFSSGLTWNFTTGAHWQHRLSGFEWRFLETNVSPFGVFSPRYNRAGIEEQSTYLFHQGGVTIGYDYEVENGPTEGRHNQAGYFEARRQFGSRLTAILGGREEDNGFFGLRFVPRAGASYFLRRGHEMVGATRLRVSYGQGIKEPDILPRDCGPQLDPERSSTLEAGLDQAFDSDRFHSSATFFHNDFRDIVSFASVASSPNCPAFFGSYFNTDEARADGMRAALNARLLRWLSISAAYAYDDSKVLKAPNAFDPALAAGNRLFKRPLHSATFSANARFRKMTWNLAGYYAGRTADSDFLGLGITSAPSWVRWDLANSIQLGHGLSTIARVENLFNRHYQIAVGYPALRLNYRLGLKYTWGGE
ncbi:MAG TPA: TonB-dependent receptor [Candidatus Acidoferrales bacterium]|nr:TonB-dependent receptor [Candidatus Acidoferrales bacterium]